MKIAKITLREIKVIATVSIMTVITILSFGTVSRGCGGGEDEKSSMNTQGIESNANQSENANNNVSVNVKMSVKAGVYYFLEIVAENEKGEIEGTSEMGLSSNNAAGKADFSLNVGKHIITATLFESIAAGGKGQAIEGAEASETIEILNTDDSAIDVNLEITVPADPNDPITFLFTVKVTAIVTVNNVPNIKNFTSKSKIDVEDKSLKILLGFDVNDVEESDLCQKTEAISITLKCKIEGEDETILNAAFEGDASDNYCSGTLTIPVDLEYDGYDESNQPFIGDLTECRITVTVTDSSGAESEVSNTFNPDAITKDMFGGESTDEEQELEGLVIDLSFDEGSGTLVNDSSGNNLNGTIYGTSAATFFVAGKENSAIKFDGNNRIIIKDSTLIDFTDGISFVFWMKLASATLPNTYGAILLDKSMGSAYQNGGFYVAFDNRASVGAIMALELEVGGANNTSCLTKLANNSITDTEWHHVAFTFNTSTEETRIYVDGVEKTLTTRFDIGTVKLTPNNLDISIGALSDGKGSFSGSIDELKIYDRALSASEIQ